MELIFKNITKYSKEVYEDFLIFHTKRNFKKYIGYTFIIIFILFYLLICSIMVKNWKALSLIVIAMFVSAFYKIFLQKKIVKDEMESDKITEEKEFEFDFYDNYIIIKQDNEEEKIKYRKLYKAFETDNYFYIYINKDNAFILNKNGFVVGKEKEFHDFIAKKI